MFEQLDYVYMPSRDVAADMAYFTDVLGGRLVFAVEGMGTRVAMVELTEGPPRVLLAGRHVAPWVGLVVVFAAWEATAALWGNDAAHPTLSLLVDPVLATYPGRVAGWIAWLGVGRWLVTR